MSPAGRGGLRPRPVRPGRVVLGCWGGSVLAGALLVLLGAASAAGPAGLTPGTLTSYLARAAGAGARDVRVNGVYGSGRDGAWQFVGHLTWRTAAGTVAGGVVSLPAGAGAPPDRSPFGRQRLAAEERIGWTLPELAAALAAGPPPRGPAALLELAIPAAGPGTLTTCAGRPAGGTCTVRDRSGRLRATFRTALRVQAGSGALTVTRG